jgi:hypothetical protein
VVDADPDSQAGAHRYQHAVLFLESSPHISGEILHIDGSQIVRHEGPG